MEQCIFMAMTAYQQLNELIYNFKINKKYWDTDYLTGEDYDIRRSKPAPYLNITIKIAKLLNLKTVIEIGSTRLSSSQKCIDYFDSDPIDAFISPPCCCDGHATFFFTRAGFEVYTVDINEHCINGVNWCYSNIGLNSIPQNLHIHIPQDGISFLENFKSKIDILYLDGWDKGTLNFAENHLLAYQASKNKLSDIHLITIDDTDFITNDGGKDKILSPFLIKQGYTMLFNGRQTLFINKIP